MNDEDAIFVSRVAACRSGCVIYLGRFDKKYEYLLIFLAFMCDVLFVSECCFDSL